MADLSTEVHTATLRSSLVACCRLGEGSAHRAASAPDFPHHHLELRHTHTHTHHYFTLSSQHWLFSNRSYIYTAFCTFVAKSPLVYVYVCTVRLYIHNMLLMYNVLYSHLVDRYHCGLVLIHSHQMQSPPECGIHTLYNDAPIPHTHTQTLLFFIMQKQRKNSPAGTNSRICHGTTECSSAAWYSQWYRECYYRWSYGGRPHLPWGSRGTTQLLYTPYEQPFCTLQFTNLYEMLWADWWTKPKCPLAVKG